MSAAATLSQPPLPSTVQLNSTGYNVPGMNAEQTILSNKNKTDGFTIVSWDGPKDQQNPQNWSRSRKWLITMLTGAMTFSVSFGSSIFSTTVGVTADYFGVSEEVMILGVTLYVAGFAAGMSNFSKALLGH